VHHRVHGRLQLQDLAERGHRDLLRQVTVGHRGRHLCDVAHLAGQVGGHEVDIVGEVLPGTGDPGYLRLAAQLALGAHLPGHPCDGAHLVGQVGGHLVDVVGQVPPGTGDAPDVRLAAQLALGTHVAGHPGDLGRERGELVDHGVDGTPDPEELAAQRPALDL